METKPTGLEKVAQACRLLRTRNLFWSWYEPRNFGDWIGPFLFRKFTNTTPLFCSKKLQARTTCLFSAGSILRHLKHPNCATIWGSGIISKSDQFAMPRKVLAVRGPETRDAMLRQGYECPAIYGDPGVLLPLFISRLKERSARIGIIPHFIETETYKKAHLEGVHIIDVCRPVEDVSSDIASCSLTYSSSLHGLIVSHAFGIPSIWMASSKELDGDDVKFEDYFSSCGLSATKRNSILNAPVASSDESSATLPDHGPLRHALLQSLPTGWRRQ